MQLPLPTKLNSQLRQFGILALVVVSIFMLERVGWASVLKQGTLTALQPIEYFGMRSAAVLEFPFYLVENEQKSAIEVQELKKSYAKALARLSELEAVEKENAALRAVVADTSKRREKRRLAAPVLSYAMTAVAVGSDDGVQEGALVYISDVVMGRVLSVTKNQSQIVLFSARDSDPVLVQTESGIQGLLVGTGKRVELTQVPVQSVLTPGERVTTVGQPGISPGQFVGVVASVAQPATAPMQTAVVDQLHSFYAVSLVEVQ